MLYAITYLLFFVFLLLAKWKDANRITSHAGTVVVSPVLLLLHGAGIMLFGALPFYFLHPGLPSLFKPHEWLNLPLAVSALLAGFTLWCSWHLARQEQKKQGKTTNGQKTVPVSYLAIYFLLRTLFIIAYEIWFRGFLLSETVTAWGPPLAIAVNLVLYTLLHTVNDKKEMIACVPFGLLLCLITLWQGSIWPAVVIHLALTIPFELTVVKHQLSKRSPYENFYYRRIGIHGS